MKRVFKLQGKLTQASGLVGSSYRNSDVIATLALEAPKSTFDSFKGTATATITIVNTTNASGQPISIYGYGAGTKIGPQTIGITSRSIIHKIENKNTSSVITINFDQSGQNIIDFNIAVKVNGLYSFLANNILMVGSGVMTQEILDEVPIVPPTQPTQPVLPWEQRLTRPMLFFSAPNYYWPDKSEQEVEDILNAVAAAGLDGISVEFGGMFISDEYNKIPTNSKVMDIYNTRLTQWTKWQKGLEKRGLVAHIAFLNSNQSLANTAVDSDWQKVATKFVDMHGSTNMLILPLSENDTRTRPSIEGAIWRGLIGAGFPNTQLISHTGKFGDFIEIHRGRESIKSDPHNHRYITVNDNGPAIADLYGSDWRNGGTPNLANISDYVKRIRAAGTSGAVYSFGKVFDATGCVIAGKAWGNSNVAVQPTPPSEITNVDAIDITNHKSGYKGSSKNHADKMVVTKTLKSARKTSDKYIVFDKVDRSGWPVVTVKKSCNAKAFIFWKEADGTVFGDHWDWMSIGQAQKGLENIHAGILKDSSGVTHIPPKGATVYVCQASTDYKQRTNVIKVDGVW